MTNPPKYFERVRSESAQLWDDLEAKPKMAGPWRELFRQVQIPRHVVSELLQNADDVGATEASVEVKDGEFIFTHDGDDFTEEDFESLCGFANSKKRTLRTIGFRGIGFKSAFSLDDEVHLITPTLSVRFRDIRFSEPIWMDDRRPTSASTEVRVRIKDPHRQIELQKNLSEWMTTPASLLFFKTIRKLRIHDKVVHWEPHGRGPVDGSEWMATSESPHTKYLVLRSRDETLPSEVQEEIRHERMIGVDEELGSPTCQVEIVLGTNMKGRLFVVLPTQVTTTLPFACNAPFIQDSVRIQIKDPATSPTNRWLLERLGRLAGEAMLAWLGNKAANIAERCNAYKLLSDVDWADASLAGSCAMTVEKAFRETIERVHFLISEAGNLRPWDGCAAIPKELFDVWSKQELSELLDTNDRPLLSRHVRDEDIQKLKSWKCICGIEKSAILTALMVKNVPKPKNWRQLLRLWAYVASDTLQYLVVLNRDIRIFPVQGSNVLSAVANVIRVGEKRHLSSTEDWTFLADGMLVLNQKWLRFLAEQRRDLEKEGEEQFKSQVESAFGILRVFGLEGASDVGELMKKASTRFFAHEKCNLRDCVRLAHIAAKLQAPVPDNFEFYTRGGKAKPVLFTRDDDSKPVSNQILVDVGNDLAEFLTSEWFNAHVLHEDYFRDFTSCTESEWRSWISSDHSSLLAFVPLLQTPTNYSGESEIEEFLRKRGAKKRPMWKRTKKKLVFRVTEWDYEDTQWKHWCSIAKEDTKFWGRLFTRILGQPQRYWSRAMSCDVKRVNTQKGTESITDEPIIPAWIARFRELPCLEDARGQFHRPCELVRRTAENKLVLPVEAFVREDFDTVSNRPLLDALGVQTTAVGAKIGLTDQPTVDSALALLSSLDSGQTLSADDLLQARQLLARYPERIWRECGHWLNIEGGWGPVTAFKYALTDSKFPSSHLYSAVKQQTADLSILSAAAHQSAPFSELPTLARCVENRFAKQPSRLRNKESKPWLKALGIGFQRVQDVGAHIHELGKRLATTTWQVASEIEIVPFIGSERIGDLRPTDAFWCDDVLYVANHRPAKMVKAIVNELGRGFGPEIIGAITTCYDRPPEFVTDYLEDNFSLALDLNGATKNLLDDTPDPTPPIPDPTGVEPTHSGTGEGAPGAGGPGPNAGGGSGSGGYGSGGTGSGSAGGQSSGTGSGGKGNSGTKGHPSGKGSKPFISYVATQPNEEESDPDGLQHEARMALEEKAIDKILADEPQLKRTPTNNRGFDLFEPNGDDEIIRRVEVKAMTGDLHRRPVGLSSAQFECAYEYREAYWLYVVEHADDPQSSRIVRIQDPAGKARTFCFDHGWISVAEVDGAETDEGDAAEETSDEAAAVGRHPQEG